MLQGQGSCTLPQPQYLTPRQADVPARDAACEGDCVILCWGDTERPYRLLIDAGRESTAEAVQAYANQHGRANDMFELFIITHIDRNHIEGAVKLLGDAAFRPLVKQVWFNDRGDLNYAPPASEFETFGALDGERLSALIAGYGIASNSGFKPPPVAVEITDGAASGRFGSHGALA